MKTALFVSAVVLVMGLHASADASTKTAPSPMAAPATAATEPAATPDGTAETGVEANPAPAKAEPPSPPIPPPPVCTPPAPQGPPPGYGYPYGGPPPGYPYPPPGYGPRYDGPPLGYPYGYAYPRHASPPREPGSPRRPYMLTLGIGMAALSGSSGVLGDEPANTATEMGISYTLRLAFAANNRWSVVLGLEGTTAEFSRDFHRGSSDDSHDSISFTSTTFSVGAQYFLEPWMYLRLGVGLGCLSWDDGTHDELTCRGMAGIGGLGLEFFQSDRISTGVELTGRAISYTPDGGSGTWFSLGLNLVLSFF